MEIRDYQPPSNPGPMTARSVTRRIIWHCTADPEGSGKGPDDVWWVHVEGNGWSHIGYHYLITEDGTVWACRPEGKVGAGVSGHNEDSIHISYVGGMNKEYTAAKDTRTAEQKASLYSLTAMLLDKYKMEWDDVHGHNEYAAKACPSFDVKEDIAEFLDDFEGGDPEPEMPNLGNFGEAIMALEKRIAELERWRKS